MYYERKCGCKGCRTCLLCESECHIKQKDFGKSFQKLTSYVFCIDCCKIYKGWDVNTVLNSHPSHDGYIGENFSGVLVARNFIDRNEESALMNSIDSLPWDHSQSGRRKQNYGPKTNFKKKKLCIGNFNGFPKYSEFLQQRFESIDILEDFHTIEQCSLEYDQAKGASIDPHIDDCWIWGERVVTVNCLSDSVLTLSLYSDENKSRYNLQEIESYKKSIIGELLNKDELDYFKDKVIRVPMPSRSLIVLFGAPRYQWEHCVLRDDITLRRVCIAYREFTPPYLCGGSKYNVGKDILERGQIFWTI